MFKISLLIANADFIETVSSQIINFFCLLLLTVSAIDSIIAVQYIVLMTSYLSMLCMSLGFCYMYGLKNLFAARISLRRAQVSNLWHIFKCEVF